MVTENIKYDCRVVRESWSQKSDYHNFWCLDKSRIFYMTWIDGIGTNKKNRLVFGKFKIKLDTFAKAWHLLGITCTRFGWMFSYRKSKYIFSGSLQMRSGFILQIVRYRCWRKIGAGVEMNRIFPFFYEELIHINVFLRSRNIQFSLIIMVMC